MKKGNRAALFVFVVVLLDAAGIGLIMPVMPDILTELTDLPVGDAAVWGGYLTFVYAGMQFLCGPTLGNLSDRFGRRPILLCSMLMLGIDYMIMGFAGSLWLLFVGRLFSGIAGATYSTAGAYMADVSTPENRSSNFGLIGAAFGVGFIIGPAIGGLLGELGSRAPFFAAAGLAFLNLLYGIFFLPESLAKENRRTFYWSRANPLGAVLQMRCYREVSWFLVAYFLFQMSHFVYPAVWSYFTAEKFGWSAAEIGLSLAAVGVGFAITQGGLIRVLTGYFNDMQLSILAIVISVIGITGIAIVTKGWMLYALMPLTAVGAVFTPAFQGLLANALSDNVQGELQGILASISGVTMIVSPLVMTQLFARFSEAGAIVYFPGAPFLAAGIFMAAALIPIWIGVQKGRGG